MRGRVALNAPSRKVDKNLMPLVRTRPTHRAPAAPRRGAFTLVEAIVAIVILSVSIPPLMMALSAMHRQRSGHLQISRARWLACEKLEDVIADRNSTTRGYAYLLTANYPAETPVSGFSGFSRSVAISETTANLSSAGTGYKRVSVSVQFTDGAGVARTLLMQTVLTDYSL